MKALSIGLLATLLAGCATVGIADQNLRQGAAGALQPLGDGNTSFAARESLSGFQLVIAYLHPQPNGSEQAILSGCRQALDNAAIRASQMRGRFINPIDNRAVSVRTEASITRPGQMVCHMSAPVAYSA